jgi:rubrerythrin
MEKGKSQLDRFKKAARELEADADEAKFNERLRKLAKQKPDAKKSSVDLSSLSRREIMPCGAWVCQICNSLIVTLKPTT